MKRLVLFHFSFLIFHYSFAQNVGIGTSTPTYKLHIGLPGGLRIEGFTDDNQNALSIGGKGALSVDAPNIPGGRFIIKDNGNIGIGVSDPQHPLTFPNTTGDKISFYGNSYAHYGIGVFPYNLAIHTDSILSDITFGYTVAYGYMIETMRVKGNGNVGIGTYAPTEKLDVAGTVRATQFKFATPKTYYYSISPISFKPEIPANYNSSHVAAYLETGAPTSTLSAPINLPNGAIISSITIYYYDGASPANLQVSLQAHPFGANYVYTYMYFTSSGTPGATFSTVIPSNPTINNQQNEYLISANAGGASWPGFNLAIGSIMITYTLSEL